MKLTGFLNAKNLKFKIIILTGLAMVAFAANSVLARLALGNEIIDAASFTIFRLLSGSLVLMSIIGLQKNSLKPVSKGSWSASFMLFAYAASFSFAYRFLDTGSGALILFGTVQITMILMSLYSDTRLQKNEWLGIGIAFSGFVYLVLPGVSRPPAAGLILMTVSGIAWGLYTLKGRASKNPLSDTAYNFLRTTPLIALLALTSLSQADYSSEGILLAIVSGGLTSGIGYTIWYIALGGQSATQAAVVQLSVPIIAALGGVLFVFEPITMRLIISSIMVLSGILIVILGRR